jgi:hypothetical protein
MSSDDDLDFWTAGLIAADPGSSHRALETERIEGFAPLAARVGTDGPAVPVAIAAILLGHADRSPYAILDAAKVPGLAELLHGSGQAYRCLFHGPGSEALEAVSPWLVALDPGRSFTRSLFTGGDAPWHLWDREPGILLTSDAPFDALWQHLRRFTQFTGKDGRRMMLRFYDPAVAYTVLDYLAPRPAEAAVWFCLPEGYRVHEVLTRRRKPGELYRYRVDHDLLAQTDLPKGRRWGEGFQDFAREERELMSSVRLVGDLRAAVPASWLPPDNRTLLFHIRQSRKAARAYGLTEPGQLWKFVYLGTICAPFFWEEPATKAFLAAHRGNPDARFADFYRLFRRAADRKDVVWRLPEG